MNVNKNRPGIRKSKEGKWLFTVWAPLKKSVKLQVHHPFKKKVPMMRGDFGHWNVEFDFKSVKSNISMEKDEMGYWTAETELDPGSLYQYLIDDKVRRPDPASNYQPEGVHGPSQLVDHDSYLWKDDGWTTPPLGDMVIYELHIGTYSDGGTFEGAISHLGDLVDLGITAVELMPVAQFPGKWNWGYDGVYPYAVQNSYGGPDGLKDFVNRCHQMGLAVILDVVYNHLGPEGNYLGEFGPYFTEKVNTPWGKAVNYDGEYSHGVRRYFIENALHWFRNYHMDGLRLDAIHSIYDRSPVNIIEEIVKNVKDFSKNIGSDKWIICENDLNDRRVFTSEKSGGFGADAQWNDDFHHSLHALITGNQNGYFSDFGSISHLTKSIREGYVYSWQYSSYRNRYHGSYSGDIPTDKFVVFIQNHDQIGNAGGGRRISSQVSFEVLKMSAGLLILSPYVPMIFMGEEYGERNGFHFFADFSDRSLADSVREGRKDLMNGMGFSGKILDPVHHSAFENSHLSREPGNEGKVLRRLYKDLILLRRKRPAFGIPEMVPRQVNQIDKGSICILRGSEIDSAMILANLSPVNTIMNLDTDGMKWKKLIDTSDTKWEGPGSISPATMEKGDSVKLNPNSLIIYGREM